MAKKALTFTFRPDHDYGMYLEITFADAGANQPKFVVGESHRYVADIEGVRGGATVVVTESRATFQNFPIVRE